jgi:hypothetical protein
MRLFGAGALAPLLLGLAFAQKDQPPTFQSGIDLVISAVVVHDAQGHAAGNLRAEDFAIFDKGKLQKITVFSGRRAGVSVSDRLRAREAQAGRKLPRVKGGIEESARIENRVGPQELLRSEAEVRNL